MKSYTPAYTQAALDALIKAGRSHRRKAIDAVERLSRDPHQTGDCTITDDDGKDCRVLMTHGVLLTYWTDDAVCEIRILAIDWTD